MTDTEFDAIRQRQDNARKERPIDPRSATEIEHDIRWLARQMVRELHERPWHFGPPVDQHEALATARQRHTQSIARQFPRRRP